MTTPLELIRQKKRLGGMDNLTACEQLIWQEYWRGKENDDPRQIQLANTAANEYAHMIERIKENLR